MKNIEIVVLSDWKNAEEKTYVGEGGFEASCAQTCETGWKYIKHSLGEQPLDCVYAFISQRVENDKAHYEEMFADQKVEYIPLEEDGELNGSFKSICKMFEKVTKDYPIALNTGNKVEEVTVHVDLTGGPRHSVMLMMALIQMLKYNKYKLGEVVYTNLQKKKVEKSKDLIDMYDLISGTQEFISFGSVDSIRNYFKGSTNPSAKLGFLLKAMEDLDSAFEVCASFDNLQQVLKDLANKLESYEAFIKTPAMEGTLEAEQFFSKLLPMLKKEYGAIIPENGTAVQAPALINWCLDKNFLQQALTLYTEWVPLYVIEQGIVEVKKQEIIKKCEEKCENQDWKDWSVVLIREYEPVYSSGGISTSKFKEIIKNQNFKMTDILNELPGNCDFHTFIKGLIQFCLKNIGNYSHSVNRLPKKDPIRILAEYGVNNFQNQVKKPLPLTIYIDTNIDRKKADFGAFILKSANCLGNDLLEEALGLKEKVDSNASKEDKRKQAFIDMYNNGDIGINLVPETFYELVMNYIFCVNNWRNTSNHASGKAGGKKMIEEIKSKIKAGLALLESVPTKD